MRFESDTLSDLLNELLTDKEVYTFSEGGLWFEERNRQLAQLKTLWNNYLSYTASHPQPKYHKESLDLLIAEWEGNIIAHRSNIGEDCSVSISSNVPSLADLNIETFDDSTAEPAIPDATVFQATPGKNDSSID